MTQIECISPIDGQVVARRETIDPKKLATVIADAKAAQKEWAAVPLAKRKEYIVRFMKEMQAMNQEIIPELAMQMGRPVRYGGEWRGFEERINFMLKYADQALADRRPPDADEKEKQGFVRFQSREPLGIVFVVAPWNYPYLTANATITPALLAGNAVFLKHAAQTLLVGDRFQQAFDRAGLPKGLFTNLVLDHGQTEQLLQSGNVNFVNFTGSVQGGRIIERAAAGTFAGVGLELGGKDPAYVLPDANITAAVDGLVDGAFYNSGQCCCGIERIYVHEKVYDAFVAGAVALTSKYVLGNPLDEKTTLGPMANKRFATLVRDQVAAARAGGAVAHIDQKLFPADDGQGTYVMPQVLTAVNHQMAVMKDETFGPVVGIMKVKNDDEAVALMNDSPYGLTASLWTNDVDHAERIGRRVETGTLFMNRCDYVDPGLGWTGVKDTGRGISGGMLGFEQVTRPKNFHLKKL